MRKEGPKTDSGTISTVLLGTTVFNLMKTLLKLSSQKEMIQIYVHWLA
jgi:hypothetical protein